MSKRDPGRRPTGPWTLDKDHPLAQGLVLWVPFAGPDLTGSLADFSPNTAQPLPLGAGWASDRWGAPAATFTGTSSSYIRYGSPAKLNMPGAWTAVSRFMTTSLAGSYKSIISNGASGSAIQMAMTANFGGTAHLDIWLSNSVQRSGATTLTTNRWYTGAVKKIVAAPWDWAVWLDGVKDGGATGVSAGADAQGIMALGNLGQYTGGGFWVGSIAETALYNIALSDDLMALATDPGQRFALWYPLRSRKWIVAGGSTTGDGLIVASLTDAGVGASIQAAAGTIAPSLTDSGVGASIQRADGSQAPSLTDLGIAAATQSAAGQIAPALNDQGIGAASQSADASSAPALNVLGITPGATTVSADGSIQAIGSFAGVAQATQSAAGASAPVLNVLGATPAAVVISADGSIAASASWLGSAAALQSADGIIVPSLKILGVTPKVSRDVGGSKRRRKEASYDEEQEILELLSIIAPIIGNQTSY